MVMVLPLATDDVSYEKIMQLLSALLAATIAGRVPWLRSGAGYEWVSPSGEIQVTPDSVSIWNDRGDLLRRFQPATTELHEAILRLHEEKVGAVIEQIMADLEAIEVAQ